MAGTVCMRVRVSQWLHFVSGPGFHNFRARFTETMNARGSQTRLNLGPEKPQSQMNHGLEPKHWLIRNHVTRPIPDLGSLFVLWMSWFRYRSDSGVSLTWVWGHGLGLGSCFGLGHVDGTVFQVWFGLV